MHKTKLWNCLDVRKPRSITKAGQLITEGEIGSNAFERSAKSVTDFKIVISTCFIVIKIKSIVQPIPLGKYGIPNAFMTFVRHGSSWGFSCLGNKLALV